MLPKARLWRSAAAAVALCLALAVPSCGGSGSARVSVTPSVRFPAGETTVLEATITNTGTAEIVLNSVGMSADPLFDEFSDSQRCEGRTLNPGDRCEVFIRHRAGGGDRGTFGWIIGILGEATTRLSS